MDERSRIAFSQVLADESAVTAAGFLVEAAGFVADHGVRIQRVLTDNAKAHAESVVVERFNKTLLEEWAYARLYRSNTERRRAFRRALFRTYNHRRPHTSLDA